MAVAGGEKQAAFCVFGGFGAVIGETTVVGGGETTSRVGNPG